MAVNALQVGGATVIGGVAGGAMSLVNGFDPRIMAINAGIGATSTLAMMVTKETTGNGGLAAAAGVGTGAVVGAALLSIKAGKIGLMPTGAGAALGAVVGGFSMLAGAGIMGRFSQPPTGA